MGSLSQSLFVPLILLNQSVDYILQMYFSNRLLVWLDLLYALRVAGALKGWCAVRTLPTSVLYKVKLRRCLQMFRLKPSFSAKPGFFFHILSKMESPRIVRRDIPCGHQIGFCLL